MTEEPLPEPPERFTWVPIAIAFALVAIILVAILTIDGGSDVDPSDEPSPTKSSTTS